MSPGLADSRSLFTSCAGKGTIDERAQRIPPPPRSGPPVQNPASKDKTALVSRLHKIEGQVRGLARMVESDEYCIDILTQIASARSALENLGMVLLQQHVEGCVRDSLKPDTGPERVEELIAAVNRFIKT